MTDVQQPVQENGSEGAASVRPTVTADGSGNSSGGSDTLVVKGNDKPTTDTLGGTGSTEQMHVPSFTADGCVEFQVQLSASGVSPNLTPLVSPQSSFSGSRAPGLPSIARVTSVDQEGHVHPIGDDAVLLNLERSLAVRQIDKEEQVVVNYGFDTRYRNMALKAMDAERHKIERRKSEGKMSIDASPRPKLDLAEAAHRAQSYSPTGSHHPRTYVFTNVFENWRKLGVEVMRKHPCFDAIPKSGKVVVFDTKLPIKHALRALAEHDIKCAPVWSASRQMFIGIMTVTDFADILSYYSQDKSTFTHKISELEREVVGKWAKFRKRHHTATVQRNFISSTFDDSLYSVVQKLNKHFIHRMPVMKSPKQKSIVGILNYSKILRFVMQQMEESYRTSINVKVSKMHFDFTLEVPSLTKNDTLLDAVKILSEHKKVPAVPIVNPRTRVVENAFLRSDIRFFAIDRMYMNLETRISAFLEKHTKSRHVPRTTLGDNVFDVLYTMLSTRQHLSLVVTDKETLIGVITLRNLFDLLLASQ